MNPICINPKGVGVQGIWKIKETPLTKEEQEEEDLRWLLLEIELELF